MSSIAAEPGSSETGQNKSLNFFSGSGRYWAWVLGIGYKVRATRYATRYWVPGNWYWVPGARHWAPGRPEADLREAGGRLNGGSGGAEPPQ